MIAHLKLIRADSKIIVYQFGYIEKVFTGTITIDLEKQTASIDITDERAGAQRMAGLAIGKIMCWHETNSLPDKYTICTG